MILLHNRVQAKIVGLPQNYYSIYKKMQGQGINKIYGLKSFKIIVQTELDCYKVLGLMHRAYMPIPSQIKDYIATPKINGYQSLNTALISKGNDITFNVMIRTPEMNNICEYGILGLASSKDSSEDFNTEQVYYEQFKDANGNISYIVAFVSIPGNTENKKKYEKNKYYI
jgi:(p)ppGpp synthase/HD superfamily hydrolase